MEKEKKIIDVEEAKEKNIIVLYEELYTSEKGSTYMALMKSLKKK